MSDGDTRSGRRGRRKIDGVWLKQGQEYFDQGSDKDTNIWGEVKLERDRKKENVEEKRRERDKTNKNSKVKYYGKNKTKREM